VRLQNILPLFVVVLLSACTSTARATLPPSSVPLQAVVSLSPTSPPTPSATPARPSPSPSPVTATAATTPPENTPPPTSTPTLSAPTATPTLAPDAWMNMPIVPKVSDTARQIYQRGLAMGNHPHRFSKIGDCQNVNPFFLTVFDYPGKYRLGEKYAYLQETIDYFHGSFSRKSLAVKGGFNVAAVLSPLRADKTVCKPTESPLACELRVYRPSFAIISLEQWWGHKSAESYATYMRKIVEYTISQGVVPILATKADNIEGDNSINRAIAEIAYEYDIPLWNFWRAAHPLPNHGLKKDGFHLTFARNYFDDPERMKAAWPWRNLTALQALDAVRRGVTQKPQP